MDNNYKLTTLLNNSGFDSNRIKQQAAKVKEDRQKITNLAEKHFSEHKEAILEGTKRRQLMLEDGKRRGLTEDQILANSSFIPSVYTPVLNWLYEFMGHGIDLHKEESRKQLNEQVGHMTHEEVKVMENTPELFEFLYGNITMGVFSKLKKMKALSRSANKNEAFQAYSMCMELCKEHKVDFDKIPVL